MISLEVDLEYTKELRELQYVYFLAQKKETRNQKRNAASVSIKNC